MVSDQEIIAAIKNCDCRAFTARETAEYHDITKTQALKRLHQLADDGPLMKKKPQKQTLIFWHEDEYYVPSEAD